MSEYVCPPVHLHVQRAWVSIYVLVYKRLGTHWNSRVCVSTQSCPRHEDKLVFSLTALSPHNMPLDGRAIQLFLVNPVSCLRPEQVVRGASTPLVRLVLLPLSLKSCVQVHAGNQPARGLLEPAPSSVPCCHQGHLLGLTDGSENPLSGCFSQSFASARQPG